jgi:uncharacterized protein
MKRRTFIKTALTTTVITATGMATGGGIALYAHQIEPRWVEINIISVQLPRLDSAFHGYRLLQISDLHADDSWMTAERVAHIVNLVNEQKPDLIVITGDFVTDMSPSSTRALGALRHLQARDGTFAILGNHDHWSNPAKLRQLLQTNSIHELNDAVHTIYRHNNTMLHIAGLDDLWPYPDYIEPVWQHANRLKLLAQTIPTTGAAILLVHEPDFADVAAANGRFDLQLSGHSHGGQIRLPFYGAFKLPPLALKYPCGMYRTGSLRHYTNRGLGMIEPQIRMNCRPEITVFVCQSANRAR